MRKLMPCEGLQGTPRMPPSRRNTPDQRRTPSSSLSPWPDDPVPSPFTSPLQLGDAPWTWQSRNRVILYVDENRERAKRRGRRTMIARTFPPSLLIHQTMNPAERHSLLGLLP